MALLHFVGRDASDEIEAYHDEAALTLLRKFIVGTVELDEHGLWHPFVPPVMAGWIRRDGEWVNEAAASRLQGILPASKPTAADLTPAESELSLKTQAKHAVAYRALHERLVDAGLYKTPYFTGYGPEVLRFIILGAASIYAYCQDWTNSSAFFLGLLWHQVVFTVHDLGHMGVTHEWAIDRLLGHLPSQDFVGGLSIVMPNHLSHDPDIEHLPIFAVSPKFFHNLWSTYHRRFMTFDTFAKMVLSIQHKIFYIVLAFGRFNLYQLVGCILKRLRGGKWAWRLETLGLIGFWCWFGAVLYGCGSWYKAVMYVLVSHITTSPLHVQLVLSHWSMSTDDLGPAESFAHRQLRTTSDVICHPYLEFLHGGLHRQVTHHLFPRLPRHNLGKASKLVKEYVQDQGLTYAEFGFREGNKDVVGVLKGVADQVRIMRTVASGEAREAVDRKIAESEKEASLKLDRKEQKN
ncbi:delta 8-sphingoloid desaturase protein [Flagelloscypha sp. PMI_526]|nr:delta 8-sphingoloid desaturase protein [Flagelloscypha sp. PMI_526]